MFTGIVEELGLVKSLKKSDAGAGLIVEIKGCSSRVKAGDSISVNGACLTVSAVKKSDILFDVSGETIERTNIGSLKAGDRVNMEYALRAGSQIGGHFVTGHVDCTGKILSRTAIGEFENIKIRLPEKFIRFLAEKGSIAVDGVSLTINNVKKDHFCITAIPHTLAETTLGFKSQGSAVNIEVDILARYVSGIKTHQTGSSNITPEFLQEHGFI